MTDPESMASEIDALVDRVTGNVTPPPTPAPPTIEQSVGHTIAAHRAHVAHAYGAYAAKVGKILDATAPRDGNLAVTNAQSSLGLAVCCAKIAAKQMVPRGQAVDVDDPALIGAVVDLLAQLTATIDSTVAGAQERLAIMHNGARAGRIAGPPASSPTAEVEAVIRELVTVTRSVQAAHRHLDKAGQRLARITTTPAAPHGP